LMSNAADVSFPKNSQVTVNIPTTFTQAQYDAIKAVFDGFTNSGMGGLTFNVHHTNDVLSYNDPNTIQFIKAPINDNDCANWSPAEYPNGGGLKHAEIVMDGNKITVDPAYGRIVTNEIGHCYGLDDCPLCYPDCSMMSYPGSCNGTSGPRLFTQCDGQAVAANSRYIKDDDEDGYIDCDALYPPSPCDCDWYGPNAVNINPGAQ
jgi:hypothetical protein